METIQVRLTKELIEKAQKLVDKGLYSNKSEVVRDSLRRLVFKETLSFEEKKKFKIIFTADMHGNLKQYEKLFQRALISEADSIIIAGDIAPKDEKNRTIKKQQNFIEKRLFPLIKKFNDSNRKKNTKCPVYLIMGNDDFKANLRVLKENEKKIGFKEIHGRIIKFHEDFKIAGYSFVPLTPFINKDWEKLDLIKEDETLSRKNFLSEGRISKGNAFRRKKYDLKNRKETIEKDLNKIFSKVSAEKLVFVAHSPPFGTYLDILNTGEHVGSRAVKKAIEKKEPYISLHGHIHESVKNSGKFLQRLNKSFCMSAGNNHETEKVSLIEFDLYNPEKAKRIII